MKTATLSPFGDDVRTRMLIDDVIDICVGRRRGDWHAPWREVLKSLRHHRWSSYTPRSGRHWKIGSDEEERVLQLLVDYGFRYHRGDVVFSDQVNKPKSSKPAIAIRSLPRPLEVASDIDAEELIEMLATEEDEARKKSIRAKLRRMGHRGGLKNFKK